MLRSKCGNAFVRQAALCVVVAVAAAPAWAAQGDASRSRIRQTSSSDRTASAANGAVVLGEPELLEAPPAVNAPHNASKPVRKHSRKASQEAGRTEGVVTDLTKPQSGRQSSSSCIWGSPVRMARW